MSIQQTGSVTPGHLMSWTTAGVAQDAGSSNSPNVNSLGLYGNGGTPFSITNRATPGAPSGIYSQLNAGVSQAAAYINVDTFGATALPLNFNINGSTVFSVTSTGPTFNAPVAVSSGGTGLSTTPADGQLLIGNGTGYTLGTLTAGANVSIVNAAGGITISAIPGGGILPVGSGGTGASSLIGFVYGNGSSAMTASATIPTSALSGTIPTSALSGTIPTSALSGTIPTSSLSGTIPSSQITGLGTMSAQNAANVAITGGSVSVSTLASATPLGVSSGGTGASTATSALANLGAAALAGSASQVFNVANAVSSSEAVALGQFPLTSSASNGSTTLPNGLVLKWGSSSTSSGSGSVTFATAFPNNCWVATLTINGASGPAIQYGLIDGSLSTTGFNVYSSPGSTLGFYWMAIGN